MLYVGVDAHQQTSQITVMDEGGQVLKRTRVATSRAAVHEALYRYRRPLKAMVEGSRISERSWGIMSFTRL